MSEEEDTNSDQFPFILLSMICGTIPISILGERFAMQQRPFWKPDQYSESSAHA